MTVIVRFAVCAVGNHNEVFGCSAFSKLIRGKTGKDTKLEAPGDEDREDGRNCYV